MGGLRRRFRLSYRPPRPVARCQPRERCADERAATPSLRLPAGSCDASGARIAERHQRGTWTGRGRVHGSDHDCSRSGLRRNGPTEATAGFPAAAGVPRAFSNAPKRPGQCVHRDLPSGRKLPGSLPVRGASACRGSPVVSDSSTLAGRRDSRFPAATACAVVAGVGVSEQGFRPGRSLRVHPPIPPVASHRVRAFQSRCTGG